MTNRKNKIISTIAMLFSTAIIVALASEAMARPNSRSMSCSKIKGMIESRGAVVISTGRYTYERYVRNSRFCDSFETTKNESIPARDTRHCRVKKCFDPSIYYDD